MALRKHDYLQMAVKDFCDAYKIRMIHIANEGKRSKKEGYFLQRQGMIKGTVDCFMPRGNEKFNGLWMELKIPPDKPSKEQVQFLEERLAEGYDACVCYNIDEAMKVIKNFYNLK